MKKLTKLFLILCVCGFLIGCNNAKEEEDGSYLTDLTYSEFVKKIENKETFFFEIMQDGCSFCQNFTPKLISVLKEYDIHGYKINLTYLTDEEEAQLKKDFGWSGTPETIFITEGVEKSKLQRIEGDVTKTRIISKLRSAGYIQEESNE